MGNMKLSNGKVAKLFGIDRTTLHYYDKLGLLHPFKDEQSYRYYTLADIIRLSDIRFYHSLSLKSFEIADFIKVSNSDKRSELIDKKISEVQYQIFHLQNLLQSLECMKHQNGFLVNSYGPEITVFNDFYYCVIDENTLNTLDNESIKRIGNLCAFIPFVHFCFAFDNLCLDNNTSISSHLIIVVQKKWVVQYNIELPDNMIFVSRCDALRMVLTFPLERIDNLNNKDFKDVIAYCKVNNINLSGKAIGFARIRSEPSEQFDLHLYIFYK